ncbi:MAG: ubiquinol-cytochrome c reductase iron-sulfur subunit [Dehalococcoidia bacterium]
MEERDQQQRQEQETEPEPTARPESGGGVPQPRGPVEETPGDLPNQQPAPEVPPEAEAWRMAAGPARTLLAAARAEVETARQRTAIAAPAPRRPLISRRTFILGSFWTGLGLAMASALGGLDFLWPRKVVGFGGPVGVPKEQIPKPGGPPVHIIKGKFWLVNLKPSEGVYGELGVLGKGGLLALWQKCPHLGCTVPWRGDFVFGGVKAWFRCPCHASTYTRAGIRVFGPAPRPMDTMAIEVQADGSIIVQTGQITQGDNENPTRAVPYS